MIDLIVLILTFDIFLTFELQVPPRLLKVQGVEGHTSSLIVWLELGLKDLEICQAI